MIFLFLYLTEPVSILSNMIKNDMIFWNINREVFNIYILSRSLENFVYYSTLCLS